jgi:hypothetical protein
VFLRIEVVFEVLVKRLQVDVIRSVLVCAELRRIEQLNDVILEIPGIPPLPLEPLVQLGDRTRTHGRFETSAFLEIDAFLSAHRSVMRQGWGYEVVKHLFLRQQRLMGEIQLLVRREAGSGEIARTHDAGNGLEPVPAVSG